MKCSGNDFLSSWPMGHARLPAFEMYGEGIARLRSLEDDTLLDWGFLKGPFLDNFEGGEQTIILRNTQLDDCDCVGWHLQHVPSKGKGPGP